MKTTNLLLLCLMAAIGFASCSENDDMTTEYANCIIPDVADEFAAATTRADYTGFPATTFEEGDQIGVYAVNTSNSTVSSNVCFTKQSDGSWTPSSNVIYNPDYKYYAYFPYKSSAPSFSPSGSGADGKFASFLTSNTFWLNNQSTKENFTTSNLMWAEGIVTSGRKIKFTMQHKRGLAIISGAVNQWYFSDDTGTKYDLTPVFSGNIPYVDADDPTGTRYFLLKPNTTTSVSGLSLSAGAGRYLRSEGIEMTGSPSISYQRSTNGGSSWSSSSKPAWMTINPIVIDETPTSFEITEDTGGRDVPGDATLKAASPVSNVDLSMVNNDGTARASRTTANCYLVHAPGTYKLPLVYGNAIKDGDESSTNAFYSSSSSSSKLQRLVNHAGTGITSPWLKNNGATPDGAQLVWEDVKGMISSVGISGDYLTFTVDQDNIAEGNAVIAATMGGTVVWSWHIWVTPQTLSDLTTIATGSHTYQVAPVNVGQVNGTIRTIAGTAGEICRVTVSSNGVTLTFDVPYSGPTATTTTIYNPSTYYQWGRKDPERTPLGAYDASGTFAQNPTNASGAYTIGTTIQNPDKHFYNSSNGGPYNENKYNYWDMNQTSTGNITTATVKTVYDPCPPGFCVPTGNLYYYMGNTGSSNSSYGTWQSTPPGRTWIYSGASLIFPASGRRNGGSGSLGNVGSSGYCWSASASNSYDGHYLSFYSGSWNWSNNDRAYGFPVRAVAEE